MKKVKNGSINNYIPELLKYIPVLNSPFLFLFLSLPLSFPLKNILLKTQDRQSEDYISERKANVLKMLKSDCIYSL